jgi:hypothetical protein
MEFVVGDKLHRDADVFTQERALFTELLLQGSIPEQGETKKGRRKTKMIEKKNEQ